MYITSAYACGGGRLQLLNRKNIKDNITSTGIRLLSEEERVTELARIIDGNEITKTSLEHAREMLDMAKNI